MQISVAAGLLLDSRNVCIISDLCQPISLLSQLLFACFSVDAML